MSIDNEMTIFFIAMFVFFICPIGIIVWAMIVDHRAQSNRPSVHHDQWSIGPLTNCDNNRQ